MFTAFPCTKPMFKLDARLFATVRISLLGLGGATCLATASCFTLLFKFSEVEMNAELSRQLILLRAASKC